VLGIGAEHGFSSIIVPGNLSTENQGKINKFIYYFFKVLERLTLIHMSKIHSEPSPKGKKLRLNLCLKKFLQSSSPWILWQLLRLTFQLYTTKWRLRRNYWYI